MEHAPGRLLRGLRAHARPMVLVGAWGLALALSVALYANGARSEGHTAAAVVAQHAVRAPNDGRVVSVSVSPGDPVRVGDPLVTLEIPGLAAEIGAATAAVRALEAELRLDAAALERTLLRDADDARARLFRARSALAEARGALATAEGDAVRHALPGVGTAHAVREALDHATDSLRAGVEARSEEVEALDDAWRDALARSRRDTGPSLASLALDTARAERDALLALEESCVLRAHVDGIVGLPVADARGASPDVPAPQVSPGLWVEAGTPLFTVTRPRSEAAVAYLPVTEARALAPGQAARLVDSAGTSHEAEIVTVGGVVEATPLRLLRDPGIPEWGVAVTARVRGGTLLPGEPLALRPGARPAPALVGVGVGGSGAP
jgi:multidrug resistance efflux pump